MTEAEITNLRAELLEIRVSVRSLRDSIDEWSYSLSTDFCDDALVEAFKDSRRGGLMAYIDKHLDEMWKDMRYAVRLADDACKDLEDAYNSVTRG